MKKTIIVTVALIALGLLYAWWWRQSVREMTAVATGTPAEMQDWASLRAKYPRFAITSRLMGLDLFKKSETGAQDAMGMMQQIYRAAGIHSMCGVLLATLSLGFLGGFTAGRRHPRKGISEPEGPGYGSQARRT